MQEIWEEKLSNEKQMSCVSDHSADRFSYIVAVIEIGTNCSTTISRVVIDSQVHLITHIRKCYERTEL